MNIMKEVNQGQWEEVLEAFEIIGCRLGLKVLTKDFSKWLTFTSMVLRYYFFRLEGIDRRVALRSMLLAAPNIRIDPSNNMEEQLFFFFK
ncbi:hypothetical protein C5167_047871 [Papaver somniferum]|uniref:Uncharacterized protein n=1 Tax=Papaver somniferum TaxID=3469 RepID=A0A4Y7LLZ3_PAPSO|nr:hypothetical protein C5167_047871 [Papaver somniferum]